MSDPNKNGQIDPDEAAGVVDEEETVNKALVDNEITDEEAAKVETLEALEKEAQKIEMEEEMGGPADVANINPDDIKIDIPEEEVKTEEQTQVAPSAPTPTEAVQEVSKEPSSEFLQEGSREIDELTSEFKKPLN